MTSLEGNGYGLADRRKHRSGGMFDRPWVTVNHPGLPSDRARNGHAFPLARLFRWLASEGNTGAGNYGISPVWPSHPTSASTIPAMEERGWGWTATQIRQARFIEWLAPQSSSATYVSVKPFYDAQLDNDELTAAVVHGELQDLDQRSLIDFAAGLGGIGEYDALATAQGRRFAEELQSLRADKRQRKAACRDAMVDWLYAREATSPLTQPVRDQMLDDPRWGMWLAEPFSPEDLDAAAAWLHRQHLVEGITIDQCEGPVRLYLTDAGVACVEEFGSDTARYVAAQRTATGPSGSNVITIHGPASGVIVGSRGVTQQAGDAIQSSGVDVAALLRFAETVAQALPVLGLSPGDQDAAQVLTGQIVQVASRPESDHSRLKALGDSLRTVLEGAAGNALAAVLLGLWHP
jgi:hypothetical protein